MKKIKIMWENGYVYSQAFKKRHISQIINEHFYRDDIVYLSIQTYPLKNSDEIILKDNRIK
jgi:hypothetical protein